MNRRTFLSPVAVLPVVAVLPSASPPKMLYIGSDFTPLVPIKVAGYSGGTTVFIGRLGPDMKWVYSERKELV